MSDVEHLLMCLLAIYMSSLEKTSLNNSCNFWSEVTSSIFFFFKWGASDTFYPIISLPDKALIQFQGRCLNCLAKQHCQWTLPVCIHVYLLTGEQWFQTQLFQSTCGWIRAAYDMTQLTRCTQNARTHIRSHWPEQQVYELLQTPSSGAHLDASAHTSAPPCSGHQWYQADWISGRADMLCEAA